jgi:DNA-binding NtrC family response regulator
VWRRAQDATGPEIVGDSEATRRWRDAELAPAEYREQTLAILITGESGTGKELVARYSTTTP